MKEEFNYEPYTEEEKAIKEYISKCQADDYDKLIQICDAVATDYGFVILEKRFVDVTRRYGIMENCIQRWDITFHNKEYFEEKIKPNSCYSASFLWIDVTFRGDMLFFVSCLNILSEQCFKYHADKRLNEEQLGKVCKWEIETYQFQPVG